MKLSRQLFWGMWLVTVSGWYAAFTQSNAWRDLILFQSILALLSLLFGFRGK